jgi:iron complex outermembrane receptor protein
MTGLKGQAWLWGCVATAALSLPAFAFAADEQPAPAGESGSTLEEVVVTAQKRAENLQNVPIAVTAVTGSQLESTGVSNTQMLSAVVPGLIVGHTSTSSSTYLRGVGQSTGTAGAEAAISTYVDGIYLSAPALGLFDFANVDQVAVLRGPQGTLFGRNSTGGLIQVTTKNPSFSTPEGSFEIGYGNLNTISGKAYVGGPIAPTLAGSLAFVGHRSNDGYIENTYTGKELGKETSYAGQAKLLWDITPDTKATLNTFITGYNGADGIVAAVYPGTLANDGVTVGTTDRVVNSRINPYQKSHAYIESLKLEHDFDWGVISNQLSNVNYYNYYHFNQNGTSGRPNPRNTPVSIFNNTSNIDNIADEFQIQSPAGQDFQWVAGAFFFHNKTHIDLSIFSDDAFVTNLNTSVVTDSIAGFAQASKTILPRLRATAGFRYTSDKHEYSGFNNLGQTPAGLGAITELKYSKPTGRLALDYDLADHVLLYASYNRGFKSGNFNNTSFTAPPFGPETVDAFEVGFKSEMFDRRVRLNSSVFYYDYKGIQLKANIPPSNVAFTYNAADSEIYGLDTDFAIAATSELTINGGFELLHAKYTSLPNGIRFVPNPVLSIPSDCGGGTLNNLVGGVSTLTSCDLSGNDIVRAPHFSANLGAQYRKELSWGAVTLNVADAYNSGFYFEPDNNVIRQPAYHWLTASLKLEPGDGRYSVQFWGVNLTNSDVFASGQSGANYTYFIGKPRTFGVTFATSF